MSDFLKKNWGWFILAAFVGLLIYVIFHNPPPIQGFEKDKQIIDSLRKELDKVDKQRKKDSISFVILGDIFQAKNDSFGVVAKTLKEEKGDLIKEVNEMLMQVTNDTSFQMCEITKKKVIVQRDSAISIANQYQKVTEDIVKGNDQMIVALTAQNHKLDSTLAWAIEVNRMATGKYDTLYKSNLSTAKKLKTAQTELRIGAGLLVVAIGFIIGVIASK